LTAAAESQPVQRRGAAIAIANLRKEYGEGLERVVALDGIDLTIAPGEFCCIVGPSGCGKSTLLRILAGLDSASGGTIAVDAAGWPVANAMVFQESGLFPWMNVETNVGFGLMTRGVAPAEAAARVDAALRLVGLTKFRHHYPHQLSGGMRQRGAIARAFVTDPGMLLMDEPFAALDAQTREFMQAELLKIWSEARKTVVFITHQINEAVYLADRVVVMSPRPGRIKDVFKVPFGRPRTLHLKRDPQFLEIEEAIWQLVEEKPERIGMVIP